MSTNNICFNKEKYCVNIIKYAPMKFSSDDLFVPVLGGYLTTRFSSNFEKLKHTVQLLGRIWSYLDLCYPTEVSLHTVQCENTS